MSVEDKLSHIKYIPDKTAHLKVNQAVCKECTNRTCTYICPANVYEWQEKEKKLLINYENCLECGACRIACKKGNIEWNYPKGINGVTYKQG